MVMRSGFVVKVKLAYHVQCNVRREIDGLTESNSLRQ